jgi:hypothetical protein
VHAHVGNPEQSVVELQQKPQLKSSSQHRRISSPTPNNQVAASPLDWVMKYARITLVQLKVVRLPVHLCVTLTLALIRLPP